MSLSFGSVQETGCSGDEPLAPKLEVSQNVGLSTQILTHPATTCRTCYPRYAQGQVPNDPVLGTLSARMNHCHTCSHLICPLTVARTPVQSKVPPSPQIPHLFSVSLMGKE